MTVRPLVLFALAGTLAAPAMAQQFRKADDAIRYRQSVMFVMGTNLYNRVGGMANGRIPFDPKTAAEATDVVVTLSRLPWIAFGPGTDQGMTDAKPGVWTEPAKFRDLSEKMQAEVLKLQAVSRTGDLDTLKTAYRATANACKACHDVYTTQ